MDEVEVYEHFIEMHHARLLKADEHIGFVCSYENPDPQGDDDKFRIAWATEDADAAEQLRALHRKVIAEMNHDPEPDRSATRHYLRTLARVLAPPYAISSITSHTLLSESADGLKNGLPNALRELEAHYAAG